MSKRNEIHKGYQATPVRGKKMAEIFNAGAEYVLNSDEIKELIKALETEAQFLSMRGMLDVPHHITSALTNFRNRFGDE